MLIKNSCSNLKNISKNTLKASFLEGTPTRNWLESLEDDEWQIISFLPENRTVCIDVYPQTGLINHISLTMPKYY